MLDDLERIASLWPVSGKVLVLTGAGISVASGIPDFRSPGGLWSKYDPQRVATSDALDNNPMDVWRFLMDAVRVMNRAEPNPAHVSLARLESAGLVDWLVTQNIDGLHQRAGQKKVIDFHGSMASYHCNSCGKAHDAAKAAGITLATAPWRCACGGVVRPDIVFFGEAIPLDALNKSGQLACGAELALIVGTSCEVAPASSLPMLTKQYGGKVAEINLLPSRLERMCDASVRAKAEEALPLLADMLLDAGTHRTR